MTVIDIATKVFAHVVGFGAAVSILVALILAIIYLSLSFTRTKMEDDAIRELNVSLKKFVDSNGTIIDDNIAPWVKSYYEKNSKNNIKVVNFKKRKDK